MTKNILLLFLTFTNAGIVKAQSYKKKLREDVCECFRESDEKGNEKLANCFLDNITKYKTEIEKEVNNGLEISGYEGGKFLARTIYSEIQEELILECDAYYHFYEKLKENILISKKRDFNQNDIDSLSVLIFKKKTPDLLWERANIHFSYNQFEKAKKDYAAALALNPKHVQSKLFLGWVYEKQGDIHKAITIYKSVYEETKIERAMVFVLLAKRKLKSLEATTTD